MLKFYTSNFFCADPAKLDSIPWLRNGSAPPPVAPAQGITAGSGTTPSAPQGGAPAPPPPVSAPAPEPVVEAPKNMVKDDPRYKPYFAMIDKGVPKQALIPRLTAEGLNPALLVIFQYCDYIVLIFLVFRCLLEIYQNRFFHV
jgi:hypothetical protein